MYLPLRSRAHGIARVTSLVALSLFACRDDDAPRGPAVDRTSVKSVTPRSLSTRSHDVMADAGPDPFATFARACGAQLPANTPLENVGDTLLVDALLPSYDRVTRRLRLVQRDDAFFGVPDCMGHITRFPNRTDDEVTLKPGDYLVTRQTLEPGRQVVWITIGFFRGLCDSPVGFLAVVRANGGRIDVEGIMSWDKPCAEPVLTGRVSFGSEAGTIDALLVPNTDGMDEPGGNRGNDVLRARSGELVVIGFVADSSSTSPFIDTPPPWTETMTADVHGEARGIVADETWTFEPHGVPGGKTHTKKVTRVYSLRGDKLVAVPAADPEP